MKKWYQFLVSHLVTIMGAFSASGMTDTTSKHVAGKWLFLFIDGKAQKIDTEKSDGSSLSVEEQKAIFEGYDVPNTGQDSKLRGWRQISENHFIRGDGRVHIITQVTSMTIFWDDLPREFW